MIRALRRGARRQSRDLAARGDRRAARRDRADQQEISDRRAAGRPAATIPALSNARRITFEYVMLKGVNDSPADARALVRLLAGIPAKVNLIPFNPWPGAPFECSSDAAIDAFGDIVFDAGYASPGAHAARPRHHGRLRPAQERERQAAQRRTAAEGAAQSSPPRRGRAEVARCRATRPCAFASERRPFPMTPPRFLYSRRSRPANAP